MKPRKCVWILVMIILLLGVAGCGLLGTRHKLGWDSPYQKLALLDEGDILHLPTGVKVTQEQLINMLGSASVVYVGEAHDNINAHKVQLEILKALAERYPAEISVGIGRTGGKGVFENLDRRLEQ